MRVSFRIPVVALLWLVCLPSVSSALTIGLIDTFQDGTTQNWRINLLGDGAPPPAAVPVNIPNGGPAGAGDAFLQLTAVGGNSSGGRLTVLNPAQWAGDYLGLDIHHIAMDVINLGTTDLHLRLEFEDPTIGPPENIAFSTDAIVVPAGAGWTHVVFPIAPQFLTAGLGSVETTLTQTTILRLYHSVLPNFPNPVFPIEAVVAQLGVDNIEAIAPEPATLLLFGAGLAAFGARRVRRRR